MDELMLLGRSPRPTTSQDLERRIRQAVLRDAVADSDMTVHGQDRIVIRAQLRGADIVALRLDASGVETEFTRPAADDDGTGEGPSTDHPAESPDAGGPTETSAPDASEAPARESPAVIRREPGTLVQATFAAMPLLVQSVPVEVEATARNIPFEWLDLADGTLAVGLGDAAHKPFSVTRKPEVRVRFGTAVDAVVAAVMNAIRAEIAEVDGLHIDREKLTLRQLGPKRVRVSGRARVRWKIFRPTFRFRTDLEVDRTFVLRLRRTRITSSNLLLKAALWWFRGRINRELRHPVELAPSFAPWVLRDLRFKAGKRVQVELSLGT